MKNLNLKMTKKAIRERKAVESECHDCNLRAQEVARKIAFERGCVLGWFEGMTDGIGSLRLTDEQVKRLVGGWVHRSLDLLGDERGWDDAMSILKDFMELPEEVGAKHIQDRLRPHYEELKMCSLT